MIYENFWVTGTHEVVLGYSDLFHIIVHRDDVRKIDFGWDEVLLSVNRVPSDEILDSLYQMRIRESDQLKSVYSHKKLSNISHRRTIRR